VRPSRSALGALIALLLLGTACQKKQEPIPRSTASSPGGATTASPSASPTAPGPSTAVKIVYAAGGDLWLYTVANDSVLRLTNTSSLNEYDPKFVDSDRISFLTEDEPGKAAIHEMRLTTKKQKIIYQSQSVGRILVHAWSPARTTIAYLTGDQDGQHHALRYYVVSSRSNKTIRSFGAFEGREFIQDDFISVEWAPDGSSVLVVASPLAAGGTMFVVRASQPNVIPARSGTFAHYSRDGKRIFYREFGGQKRWFEVTVPGNVATSLNASAWTYRMSVSPDGKSLAYDNGGPSTSSYVYVVSSRSQRRAGPGVRPLWLSLDAIAAEKTVPCSATADDPCFEPFKRTGTVNRLSLTGDPAKPLKLKATDGDVLYQ
jgi:Tol biopolymer transport system component